MRPGGGKSKNKGKEPKKDTDGDEFFVAHKVIIA